MAYNAKANNQWRSPIGAYGEDDEDLLGPMASQTPKHPIPSMQGAFEESMLETINEEEEPLPMSKRDSVYRRKVLLERPQYERTVAGKWKQRHGERFHPLWKIVAQISFGMHLLHQGIAKSDEEVLKILQNHVDEVDGFLERTTDDFDLAQHDITERVRYLNLPLEHGDVFDSMLGDRAFRAAMVEGNIKIEHIIDRTQVALTDSLKDVKKGSDGTRELSKYLRRLERTWDARDNAHSDVFIAMIGNTEGWSGAFAILQDKGKKLNESLEYLRGIISEIQRLVGIASRRDVPKPFVNRSQASTAPHSKKSSRRASPSPPRQVQSSRTGQRVENVPQRRGYGHEYVTDRAMQKEHFSRSKRKARTVDPSKQEPTDARSQLPSRRASFSERTRSITQKLSIRSPTRAETANEAKAAKAYPQTAIEPKSGFWGSLSNDRDGDEFSRHRKTQSLISPHTPYDLDYILRVTPSDTTISPMRDSDLSGLRSAGTHFISPISDVLGPRSAPPPQTPVNHYTPLPLQPRGKRITTIQENVSGENSANDVTEKPPTSDQQEEELAREQEQSLLRDMEATKAQISQAAAVRPLKPATRELPLRDFVEQQNAKDDSKKPDIRASSIYSRTTDLKSMFSPPQAEKENLMKLLRMNTEASSVYDTDLSPSNQTEGTLSPPPAGSSAKPSPLNIGGSKPTQFSEQASKLEPRIEEEPDRNEDLFPPRAASRNALVRPTEEKEVRDRLETAPAADTVKPPSPGLAALTSATITSPELDFPFLSATVNGPEPDFYDPSPTGPGGLTDPSMNGITTKHPELVQRIAAATGADTSTTTLAKTNTSTSSAPKSDLAPTISSSSADAAAAAPSTKTTPTEPRARRRDVPPNLKLFPAPDQYSRAAPSPRSPKLIDLRPPGDTLGETGGGATLHPPPPGSRPLILGVPPGEDPAKHGYSYASAYPATSAGANGKPKSPGWRRILAPGLITSKLQLKSDREKGTKGHRRGKSSGDNGSKSSLAGFVGGGASRNGSNGRITPVIGDPVLKGSSVALPASEGQGKRSLDAGARPENGRPSVERTRFGLRLGGSDGKPF